MEQLKGFFLPLTGLFMTADFCGGITYSITGILGALFFP
jgi:hypothetical protein